MHRLTIFAVVCIALLAGQCPARAATFTVPSNPLWTNTGITLAPSTTIIIQNAHGAWNWGAAPAPFGPDGDLRPDLEYDEWITNGHHGQLIGFIGSNPYSASQNDPRLFPIGTATLVLSGKSGQLWLGFNDDFSTGAIQDNTGSVAVDVSAVSGEPNSAHLQIVGDGTQATLSVGQCVTLDFKVRFTGTEEYVDVTNNPHTTYLTDPSHGSFTGNVFCARAADANKTFTVYGRYQDPNTKVSAAGTVIIHVSR